VISPLNTISRPTNSFLPSLGAADVLEGAAATGGATVGAGVTGRVGAVAEASAGRLGMSNFGCTGATNVVGTEGTGGWAGAAAPLRSFKGGKSESALAESELGASGFLRPNIDDLYALKTGVTGQPFKGCGNAYK